MENELKMICDNLYYATVRFEVTKAEKNTDGSWILTVQHIDSKKESTDDNNK